MAPKCCSLFLCALLLAGPAAAKPPIRDHSNNDPAAATLTCLPQDSGFPRQKFFIDEVDGQRAGTWSKGLASAVRIAPGTHRITLRYVSFPDVHLYQFALDAQAHQHYACVGTTGAAPAVRIVDARTQALVAEPLSASTAQAAAAAPVAPATPAATTAAVTTAAASGDPDATAEIEFGTVEGGATIWACPAGADAFAPVGQIRWSTGGLMLDALTYGLARKKVKFEPHRLRAPAGAVTTYALTATYQEPTGDGRCGVSFDLAPAAGDRYRVQFRYAAPSNQCLATIDRYDPAASRWQAQPVVPSARGCTGAPDLPPGR